MHFKCSISIGITLKIWTVCFLLHDVIQKSWKIKTRSVFPCIFQHWKIYKWKTTMLLCYMTCFFKIDRPEISEGCALEWSIEQKGLTFILFTWKRLWDPKKAKRWEMGLNSAFKELSCGGPTSLKGCSGTDWVWFREVILLP